MKKRIAGALAFIGHSHTFAAVQNATVAGGSVGVLTALAGLRPEIWACATFGAAYAYMLRKDAPRSRLVHMAISILIAVFASDTAAAYLTSAHKIQGVFLTPLLALLIAAAFPWLFEKYVVKRK